MNEREHNKVQKTIRDWNQRLVLEPPQLIRDGHYMVLPQTFPYRISTMLSLGAWSQFNKAMNEREHNVHLLELLRPNNAPPFFEKWKQLLWSVFSNPFESVCNGV